MASESEAAEVEIEADGVRVLVRKYASSAIQAAPPAQVVMAESMPVTDVAQGDNQSPVASESSPEPPVAKGSPVLSPTPGLFMPNRHRMQIRLLRLEIAFRRGRPCAS